MVTLDDDISDIDSLVGVYVPPKVRTFFCPIEDYDGKSILVEVLFRVYDDGSIGAEVMDP